MILSEMGDFLEILLDEASCLYCISMRLLYSFSASLFWKPVISEKNDAIIVAEDNKKSQFLSVNELALFVIEFYL